MAILPPLKLAFYGAPGPTPQAPYLVPQAPLNRVAFVICVRLGEAVIRDWLIQDLHDTGAGAHGIHVVFLQGVGAPYGSVGDL